MSKEEFVKTFQKYFGSFICVDDKVIEDFYDTNYEKFTNRGCNDEYILDLAKDYVLSQDLEEEVVE